MFLFFSCKKIPIEFAKNELIELDSVNFWITESKGGKLSKKENILFLEKALNTSLEIDNDSLRILSLLKISDCFYNIDQDSLFRITNENIYELATISNDTSALAEYHWNIGNLLTDEVVLDSAYFHYGKARQFYFMIGNDYYRSKMDYNLSFLEFRVKNYLKSEISIISAINGFEKLDRKLSLFKSYNRLLLIDRELGNYASALNHYKKASTYLAGLDKKGIHKEKLLNNLSLIYQKQKEYDLAIETLNEALGNSDLREKHSNLYAKLIDNKAFCMFLNKEDDNLLQRFNEALTIRQNLENEAGIVVSYIHLSQYFLKKKDSMKASRYAKSTYEISSRLGIKGEILESL
jgi:two-component system NarL family sensor kinase